MRALQFAFALFHGLTATAAFGGPFFSRNRYCSVSLLASSATTTEESTTTKTTSTGVPSWDDLASIFKSLTTNEDNSSTFEDTRKPMVTLYRDSNGWCPFCERVWLALHIKNIPYQERLVNLRDKPDWFLDMVPTGLVPAILFHDDLISEQEKVAPVHQDDNVNNPPPARSLIWESRDILKVLDDKFPDTPQLLLEDNADFLAAREIMSGVSSAGFKFTFSSRNATMGEDDKQALREAFEDHLDKLENHLASSSSDGPYMLGGDITGVDIESVPILERWRYQLPVTMQYDIAEGRPHLQNWYDALDSYAPFINRVAGDKYSWTAVASTFLKMFNVGGANATLSDGTLAAMKRAEEAARQLQEDFGTLDNDFFAPDALEQGRLAAIQKLLSNHEAVVGDCTRKGPQSQVDLTRAKDSISADWVLRLAVSKLLTDAESGEQETYTAQRNEESAASIDMTEAAHVARVVASRLCAPRDMGAPAAAILRKVLVDVAADLEQRV
jgi:glutathione S-transferase